MDFQHNHLEKQRLLVETLRSRNQDRKQIIKKGPSYQHNCGPVMGTKVQLKSYLPEFSTTRDLNEDADSSWSHPYGNRAMGMQLYGHDQQAWQSNRYSGCDRESIKRTIIEQNATFRNQVYELHRVYNRQKELMNELKKGPYGNLQTDISLSNSYTSQIPSDGANKMRHTLHLPSTSTSYNKVPVTLNNDMMSPLNILQGSSTQSGPILIGKGVTLKDNDMHKRCSGRMFDLELPADVYIDCEDAEKSEKEIFAESSSVNMFSLNSIQAASENDVTRFLRTSESFNYRGDKWRSDMGTQNGVASCGFADLNEPAGSVSYNFLEQRTTLEENQRHQLPGRSNTSFPSMQSSFFSGRHSEQGAYPSLSHATKGISQERQFFNDEAGQTCTNTLFIPVSSKENFSMSSAVTQLKLKQPLEFFSPNQNRKDIQYQQKQGHSIDSSGRYAHCEWTAPSTPNSFSTRPTRDYMSTASSLFSSWTNPPNGCSNILLAGHSCPSDKWRSNGDLKSYPILGAGSSSHQNGNFRVEYGSASQLHLFGNPNLNSRIKGVNLNQALPMGIEDCRIVQNNTVTSDSKGKCGTSSGFLSWLKKPAGISSSHIELDFSQDYPKLKTQEMEKSRPKLNLQDPPSTSQVHKNESSDGRNSNRLFGFTIFDGTKQNPELSASHHEPTVTSSTKCSEKDLEIKNHVGDPNTSSVRSHINLNSDPSSWEIPNEDEIVVVPPRVSAPSVASVIDLEAPATSPVEELHEALAKEAAENILSMSSNRDSHLDDIARHPLPCGPFDTLQWFAEVVSSNSTKAKESSNDVLDLFEQTTLELVETKPEEFWHRPWKGEEETNDDDDQKNIAESLLFTKARRGQGRKRRQRRDFQTDILPGLVSLSRNEVTEDLQTISGMMKASGQSWQYGVARRNTGRNARNMRVRGGPRSSTVTVAEVQASPPLPPPVPAGPQSANNIEVKVDGANIVGWGRTTRRCWRQRCPPVANVAASIT